MVEAAYAEVERLTRQRARNFAYGIMLLPRPKRRAIAAVYALFVAADIVLIGRTLASMSTSSRPGSS